MIALVNSFSAMGVGRGALSVALAHVLVFVSQARCGASPSLESGEPAPWGEPLLTPATGKRVARYGGLPLVLRGPLPCSQYRQARAVVYKTPWRSAHHHRRQSGEIINKWHKLWAVRQLERRLNTEPARPGRAMCAAELRRHLLFGITS